MASGDPALPCQVHRTHSPIPLRTVPHHIQPQAMGGPDVAANKVQVCDTGHFNIHRLLDDLLNGLPMRRAGTAAEHRFAKQGFDAWVAAGRPGKKVYELHDHLGH